MKKIIVAAAIALAAVCSQAASMKWTVTGTAADAGLNVYIVSAIAENGFKDEASISSYLIGNEGNTGTFAGSRTGSSASGTVRGIDDSKAGQTQDFYYVIVSKDGNGYWAGSSSAEIYSTATTHVDSKVAGSDIMKGDYTKWGSSTPVGPDTPGGVPEPTSGLLLVLGGAALALRRKQK